MTMNKEFYLNVKELMIEQRIIKLPRPQRKLDLPLYSVNVPLWSDLNIYAK